MSDLPARECSRDEDCIQDRFPGRCEKSDVSSHSWCAFTAGDCPSGERWGVLAGDGLADVCVRQTSSASDGGPDGGGKPDAPLPDARVPDAPAGPPPDGPVDGTLALQAGATFALVHLPGSSTASVVIQNIGTMGLSDLTTRVVPAGSEFNVTIDGCGGHTLAAGATCTTTVKFAPTSVGMKSATLVVGATAAQPLTVDLEATATAHISVTLDQTWCNGSVTSSDGVISCGATCEVDVTSDVILTAHPMDRTDRTCRFDGWTTFGCSGTGTCAVSVTSNRVVHAAFSPPGCIDAATGLDTSAGTCTKPWKTIAHALDALSPNPGTLQLKPGVYSDASGETFPILVPSGTSLVGDEATKGLGPAPTEIRGNGVDGNGYTLQTTGSSGVTLAGLLVTDVGTQLFNGVIFSESTESLTIRNSTLAPTDMASPGNISGLLIQTCSDCALVGNTISGFGSRAVDSEGNIAFRVESNVITHNASGFNIFNASTAGAGTEDLGGGPFGSAGHNVFSCNVGLDVMVFGTTGDPPSARGNTWDHAPPTVISSDCSSSPGIDICSTVTIDTTGYTDPPPADACE